MGFLTALLTGGLGTGVGAGIGASNSSSPEEMVTDLGAGAVLGGLAGGAALGLSKAVFSKQGAAAAWAGTKGAAHVGWGASKLGARAAGGLTRFAMRNPYTALGLAAAGIGLGALVSSGATGANPGEVARFTGATSSGFDAGEGGAAYQDSKNSFINSTGGLVQGLSRGRHG